MNPKKVTSIFLLAFVAISLLVLAVKESKSGGAGDEFPEVRDGVIVYYFHTDKRCVTCETVEAATKEAVEGGFADELKNGKVHLRIVNFTKNGNERFAKEYELVTFSVVMVKMKDGRQVQVEKLDSARELAGDKTALVDFIRQSVRSLQEDKEIKTETAAPQGGTSGPLPQ